MLGSQEIPLLRTFTDGRPNQVEPLDFTALLSLRDRGYVDVYAVEERIFAQRTPKGRQVANDIWLRGHLPEGQRHVPFEPSTLRSVPRV